MNEPKPVYCIKSRGGRVEKEGDFSDIVAWLKENRVTCDDDLRRLGYHVLEKDELWGRVKDFPEFNQTERQGRRALHKARNLALLSFIGACLFAAAGVALICYDQVIPRYTESNKVDEARADAAAARKLEKVARDDLEKVRADADAALRARDDSLKREREALKGQLVVLQSAYDKAIAENKEANVSAATKESAQLFAAKDRIAQLAEQMESQRRSYENRLSIADSQVVPLKNKIAQLQKENDFYRERYVTKDEQLRAERGKSIVQKIFGTPAVPVEE